MTLAVKITTDVSDPLPIRQVPFVIATPALAVATSPNLMAQPLQHCSPLSITKSAIDSRILPQE